MKKVFSCLGLALITYASSTNAAHEDYAQKIHQQGLHNVRAPNPGIVPGFQGASPPQTAYNDLHALEAATSTVLASHETAKFVVTSAENRPYFRLDLDRDPLITNAEAAVQTPQAVLQGAPMPHSVIVAPKIVTCQEGKPATGLTCTQNLLPPQFEVTPAKYSHYWCAVGRHRPDDPSCRAKTYYNPARMYAPEKITLTKEAWTSTCPTLEEKERRGLCRLVKKECPAGPETREVVGKMGDKTVTRSITRPCWRHVLTFTCHHSSAHTCETLRTQGCEQINSTCLHRLHDTCVAWQQTFRCGTRTSSVPSTPTKAYSLPPVPAPRHEGPNKDMPEVISRLAVLEEVQKDLGANGDVVTLPLIFKGENRACTIAFGGFNNCCKDGKGWGVSLGLTGCSGEEKDLAERQSKGRCHEIGTYCAEKKLGVCLRKKRQHCCFPSKLARIVHEQGRPQLGLGWGSPDTPECRGFVAEELGRINFDKLDLREIYADVMARMQLKATNVVQRNLGDRVQHMTHSFKSKPLPGGL